MQAVMKFINMAERNNKVSHRARTKKEQENAKQVKKGLSYKYHSTLPICQKELFKVKTQVGSKDEHLNSVILRMLRDASGLLATIVHASKNIAENKALLRICI